MPDPRLPEATDDDLDALAAISEQDVIEAQASALATDDAISDLLDARSESMEDD